MGCSTADVGLTVLQSGLACAGRGLAFAASICLFENRGSLRNLSILHRVKDRAEALTRQISSSDSLRLDDDLGSVREIETHVEAMRKSLKKAQDAAKGQNRPVFSLERQPTECLISATVLVKELDLPKRGNTRMVRSTRPLPEDSSRANSMEST